jgi:hypothetical protein
MLELINRFWELVLANHPPMIPTTFIIESLAQVIRFTFDQLKTQCMHLMGPNFTQINVKIPNQLALRRPFETSHKASIHLQNEN